MPSGIVLFPGIDQILSATVSYGRGIRPSITQIEIAPQANFVALTGDLVWTDQNATVTFFDCRVDIFSFVYDQRGLIWQLRILDRRWKWDYPTISGHYNLRHDSGNLIQDSTGAPDIIWNTVATVQQLARACLIAMGEVNYDVSALPSNAFPLVSWENEKAAVALEQLCQSFGCHVVIDAFNNVVICQVGIGAQLPLNGQILANSGSLDIPEVPDQIVVKSAPIRTQADFVLEAVGKELNGTIKTINTLSYQPGDNWQNLDIYRQNMTGAEAEQARRTIFRMYRVQMSPPQNIVTIDEDGNFISVRIDDPLEIAPCEDNQCEMVAIDGHANPIAAMVWGIFYSGTEGKPSLVSDLQWIDSTTLDAIALFPPGSGLVGTPAQQYAQKAVYKRGFSLDREKLIVHFSEPVYQIIQDPTDPGNTIEFNGSPLTYFKQIIVPANILLRIAFSLRDTTTRAFYRLKKVRATGQNNGTAPRTEIRDDVVPIVINNYPPNVGSTTWNPPSSVTTNGTVPIPCGGTGGPSTAGYDNPSAQLNYYINGILSTYQATTPQTVQYAWLQAVSLDGAIFQITYSFSESGFFSTLSRNTEQIERIVPYKLRRFYSEVNSIRRQRDQNTREGTKDKLRNFQSRGDGVDL